MLEPRKSRKMKRWSFAGIFLIGIFSFFLQAKRFSKERQALVLQSIRIVINDDNNTSAMMALSAESDDGAEPPTHRLHAWRRKVLETNESPRRNSGMSRRKPYTVVKSLIHDATVDWDPTVDRLWLDPSLPPEEEPTAMLLLTNYGWNQRDSRAALNVVRHIRGTELLTGWINHPWFHPTAWEEIEDSSRKNLIVRDDIRFYVFMDVFSLEDAHYPTYATYAGNYDTSYGRMYSTGGRFWWKNLHEHPIWTSSKLLRLDDAPAVPASVSSSLSPRSIHYRPNARVVHWDCSPYGPREGFRDGTPNSTLDPLPLALASYSAVISLVNETIDQGLVPPPINVAHLTAEEEKDIDSCTADLKWREKRPLWVSYIGNFRSGRNPNFQARSQYKEMHDDRKIFAMIFNPKKNHTVPISKTITRYGWNYTEVLTHSVFALAGRGDNKYSYRFTEVLSSGAIPVVHSDDWVWPFRPELFDWNECALIVPERDAGTPTIKMLDRMSAEERCRRRKRCRDIYHRYVETPAKIVEGTIQGLELLYQGHHTPMVGLHCNSTDPELEDCNTMR